MQHPDPEAKKPVRKYEVFPGRNKFYCNGRVMCATQMGIFYFTVILIVGTSICFFAIDAKFLWESDISPAMKILPLIAAVLCIFVVSTLCRTALGDPGILPRATAAEAAALDRLIEEENSTNQTNNALPYRPPPRIREVVIKGHPIKLKYCYTCKIFRPPRASHCSVCDNCVDRFDHHCPWVGNCVGRRNYKYFYLFLSSVTIYCLYLMGLSIACLAIRAKTPDMSFQKALEAGPLSPVVALVAFFSIWSVAGLAGFHTYLIALGITTNEDIKGSFKRSKGGNPFSAGGCCTNCIDIICGPIPPSLVDARGFMTHNNMPNNIPVTNQPNRRFGGRGATEAINGQPATSTSVNVANPKPSNLSNRSSDKQPLADHMSNYNEQDQNLGTETRAPHRLPPLHNQNGAVSPDRITSSSVAVET